GILFPAAGALPRLVAQELSRREIPHNDAIGHPLPGPFEEPAWKAWLALQASPRLITLVRFLRAQKGFLPSAIDPAFVLDRLHRIFSESLIDSLQVLREACRRGDAADQIIAGELNRLHLLPLTGTFSEFLTATAAAFAELNWQERTEEL